MGNLRLPFAAWGCRKAGLLQHTGSGDANFRATVPVAIFPFLDQVETPPLAREEGPNVSGVCGGA